RFQHGSNRSAPAGDTSSMPAFSDARLCALATGPVPMPPIDPQREAIGRNIAAVLMAQQIKQWGRIEPETILTALGALAGFSAQMSIRKGMIEPQRMDPSAVLSEVITKNDERYYFSDLLNWIVFENLDQPPYSIWTYIRE